MKQMRKICILLLGLLFLSTGCRQEEEAHEPEDTVKVSNAYFGLAYYPEETINPVTTTIAMNRLLCEALYEGLFEVSNNFTAQGALCADYRGDGTEFVFTLKDNVSFWSGAPLRSSDVVTSLEKARTDEDSPYHIRMADVETIEAPTDTTVRITLRSPNINFPRLLDIPIYRENTTETGGFVDGTGPFRPERDGSNWILTANSAWHGGFLGSIRRITLVEMTEPDAMVDSFQMGDISLIRIPRIAPEGIGAKISGNTQAVTTAGASLHYLGINYRSSALAKKNVRQALSLALARQSICDTPLQTFADPAVAPVNPQPDGITLSMNADVSAAADLLKAETETIHISLLVNENNAFKTAAAEQIANSWNALNGVQVTVDKEPYNVFLSMLRSGSFDVYYGETQMTPDFDLRPLLFKDGDLNYGAYDNEDTESVIEAARRGENVAMLYQWMLEEMPLIPIAFEKGQLLIRQGLIMQYLPSPYNAFANLEEWIS